MTRLLASLWLLLAAALPASAQFADQATFAGTGAGTANAQTVTLPNVSSLADVLGVTIKYIPGATNTGAATINISTLGAVAARKPSSAGLVPLSGNELVSGQGVYIMYDGTFIDVLSSVNSTIQNVVTAPQGYLTPCQVSAGSPVSGCTAGQSTQTGDVVSATALYYEPVAGNLVPLYNGTNMVMTAFGELTLTIPSSRLANTIYDVYVFNNAGTVTAAIGVAWTTSTAGAGARGTGAGTAQVVQVQGVWTNAVSMSAVNGASTFTIPVNQGTVVGTLLIDGAAGQVSAHRTWGASRKFGYWNFYNQQQIVLKAGDSTASRNYTTNTVRASNGASTNSIVTVTGLPIELPSTFSQYVQQTAAATNSTSQIGVCFNSTSAFSGRTGQLVLAVAASTVLAAVPLSASYTATPSTALPIIGQNTFTACESNPVAASVGPQFNGTENSMVLEVRYRG